eukprot:CAMPEP_0197912438 /NCGR_PEP_ID=MMETSP1439-20131203/74763_1 /TAXON_ID=66791 /ORGANISM="Gonyaulax spinifera, Strain CCMP409" /LENGTH=177 /DNA_ID=CAMNT_0043534219 /DNA_START=45 /DNA_END=575 /DNA_ORIENTATION=+
MDPSDAVALPGTVRMEDLMHFKRWKVFLDYAVSSDVERNGVYIRSRHMGNPKFFEQTREHLAAILGDCDLLSAMRMEASMAPGVTEAFEALLEAQLATAGFLFNRQFHKALTLGELCVAITDALATEHVQGFLFWRTLARANLGRAQARFRRLDEARGILRQGLELVGVAAEAAGPR